MADFEHRTTIAAAPETVRRLLTERGEDWWTTDAVVDGKPGGISMFRFPGAGFFATLRVRTNEPGLFEWECLDSRNERAAGTAGERDWVGSTVRFAITPAGDGATDLVLRHSGLGPSADYYKNEFNVWGYYLDSLKALAETGRGNPYEGGRPS